MRLRKRVSTVFSLSEHECSAEKCLPELLWSADNVAPLSQLHSGLLWFSGSEHPDSLAECQDVGSCRRDTTETCLSIISKHLASVV